MSIKDVCFVDYVNEKLSRYEEGEPMEADQLMTLTANKYKNMMIKNQWEAPSPHDTTIQALESKVEILQRELKHARRYHNKRILKRRKRTKVQNHNVPNGKPTMRNHRRDNNPAPGYGMETNGTGVPRKLEVNVRDVGSINPPPPPPPPLSCEGKAFRGFNKRGTCKETPHQEKTEKKNKRDEENDNDKEQKRNRLTAAFATAYNEANNSSENEE